MSNTELKPTSLPSGFPGIDNLYVMNLAKNVDRKVAILSALDHFGVRPEAVNFVDTVNGRDLLGRLYAQPPEQASLDDHLQINALLQTEGVLAKHLYSRRQHQKLPYLTIGEIGVASSARNAFQAMLKHKDRVAMLLEDDVQFVPDFPDRLAELMPHLPENWEIVSLSWLKHPEPQPGIIVNEHFMIPYQASYYESKGIFLGLESLLISKNGAKKLSQYLFPLDMCWDFKIDTLKNLGLLNFYAARQSLTRQDQTFASDIQTQVVFY